MTPEREEAARFIELALEWVNKGPMESVMFTLVKATARGVMVLLREDRS